MARGLLPLQVVPEEGRQDRLQRGLTGLVIGFRPMFEIVLAPEGAPLGTERERLGGLAEALADAGQRAKGAGQALFQVGLDGAGQHGRGTLGADGDRHGVAVDDCRGDELRGFQVVYPVGQCAVGLCQSGDAGVFRGVVVGGVEQRGAGGVAGFHRTADQREGALGGPAFDLRRRGVGDDGQPGLGLEKQAKLGDGGLATARKDDAAAFDGQEDRKMLHHGTRVAWEQI